MDKKHKNKNDSEKQIEHEIRQRRRFSINEALARKGAGLLKGASPVPTLQQMHLEIDNLLEEFLDDREGALAFSLLRRARFSNHLLTQNLDDSKAAFQAITKSILKSEGTLGSFVHDVDMEWGRIYQERPHFNLPGKKPSKKDPYTIDSVKKKLEILMSQLDF